MNPSTRRRARPRIVTFVLAGLVLVLAACGGTEPAATSSPDDEVVVAPEEVDPAEEAELDQDPNAVEQPTDPEPTSAEDPDPSPSSDPDGAGSGEEPDRVDGAADGDCSAQGHRVTPAAADDLPDEVLALRDFLIDAALRCDEQLLFTAIEESESFNFSFGAETDALSLWWELEEAGEEPFLRMAQVLATTPALADGGETFVWPQVATGRSENTTPDAWEELLWLDDHPGTGSGDGYLGWRAGISTDGQWRFFVRGD